MRFRREDCGSYSAVASVVNTAHVPARSAYQTCWRVRIRVTRTQSGEGWMCYRPWHRSGRPHAIGGNATGYGRTREDAVEAWRAAVHNGWTRAGQRR